MPEMSDPARRALEIMNEAAEDISRIVARMREFYRKRVDPEQLRPLDINHLVEEVIELTRPRWRDVCQRTGISINVHRELDPTAPILLSDPSELREALINLIFNAIEALPKGGTITLATRSSSNPTHNGDGKPVKQLQVEVKDDGVGMDEKTRQRCLEPIFRTKAKTRRDRPWPGDGLRHDPTERGKN